LGEILAFVDKRAGREMFKAVMNRIAADKTPREMMLMAAVELKCAGKHQVAELAKAAALRCPNMMDLRFCRYTQPPYPDDPRGNELNIRMWRRSQRRRAERQRQKCRAMLSRKGIDANWLDNGEETDATGS
jgi:hypothetical protein